MLVLFLLGTENSDSRRESSRLQATDFVEIYFHIKDAFPVPGSGVDYQYESAPEPRQPRSTLTITITAGLHIVVVEVLY